MIKNDNLFIGKEAREKLMAGVTKAAKAVGVTLGTGGSNSLIEVIERPGHFATNDGATILNSIKFADPLEEMGRSVLYEAVSRANKQSGDGSSSATVLTAAILEEGMKRIDEVSPMELKRSLEACIPLIEENIKGNTNPVTVDEVGPAASISAEDEGIGNMIQEIYQQIGAKGIVQWDISKTPQDWYEIGTGITLAGATYVTPYMCDRDEKTGRLTNSIRLKDIKILLTKQKITSIVDINKVTEQLFQEDVKEVVIFCEEIDPQVVSLVLEARRDIGFRIIIVKMPILWRDEWWEDLALASGATIISSESGVKLRYATTAHLGTVGHITITKEDTIIDGIQDLTKHILGLQVDGSDAALLRASRLNTKTARYFVGAPSESALAYRRLKVEDAINAASCALDNGVVAGGGIALLHASKALTESGIGGEILQEALKAPFRWIVENAGANVQEDGLKGDEGFDSRKGLIVENMFDAGIVDPADVVLNAIKNAIGVAASILTVETVVILPKEEQMVMQMAPQR